MVGVQLGVGWFFGFFSGWWRYVGLNDVMRLATGLTVSLALLFAIWYGATFFSIEPEVSRGALLANWAFAVLCLFAARAIIRIVRDVTRADTGRPEQIRNVLIIGAGDAGESLAREIQQHPQLGMRVVAFVDDHPPKWNAEIRGIRVDGPISEVARIAEQHEATEAFIVIPTASGARIREVVSHLNRTGLQFKTVPGIDQIVSGQVHLGQLRPVKIEDLLRRHQIVLPGDETRKLFRGRSVLITGAGGTIGAETSSQILAFEPSSLDLIERSEYALFECHRGLARERSWLMNKTHWHVGDFSDTELMRAVLQRQQPQIVVHAAAHKHVPLGEENPIEYIRNNCLSALAFAALCAAEGVERFIFISTDKAINPSGVMGASKRAAEIALLDLASRTSMKVIIVRFGNVLGSSGSVVPTFLDQIENGGPITVTHPETTRYFLRKSEAVSLVLQAAAIGEGARVYMLDMGDPIRIADLARDLIRLSNKTEEEIPIQFIGMRPGEKLSEELRLDGDWVHPTKHPQILVTEAPQPDPELVRAWIERLSTATRLGPGHVKDALVELIPEYSGSRGRNDRGRSTLPSFNHHL